MSSTPTFQRPGGEITTLLDLTPRDMQDNAYFPIKADVSWWARDSSRRSTPFTSVLQDFQHRGPGAFGQRFTFDIASQTSGDLVLGAVLQLQLTSWLPLQTVLQVQSEQFQYVDPAAAWFYANSIGQILIQSVELEIDGVTIEQLDGDFAYVFSALYPDLNAQIGVGSDHTANLSVERLKSWPPRRVFPTENGYIHCILPLFFGRTRLKEGMPLIACREGTVRLHVTLRPFQEIVRQARGFRDSCDSVPVNTVIPFYDRTVPFTQIVPITTLDAEPQIQNVRLLTWGVMLDGAVRQAMIRQPFEIMHRTVQTFAFTEPLKYVVAKTGASDIIRVQLPLEANQPLEEILWYIRRKDVANNNEWTNYSAVLEREYDPVFKPRTSMLVAAKIQANGIDLVEGEESYFRQLIASHHRGGIVAYNAFVYGYPIGRWPGETHNPTGTVNASRLQSLRLTLDVRPPGNAAWEVKVFCIGLEWLRFQNGIANKMFQD